MVPIPTRRPRAPMAYEEEEEEEEEDDDEETPTGSPSYRPNGNKRQRLSTASVAPDDTQDGIILPDGYDTTQAINITEYDMDAQLNDEPTADAYIERKKAWWKMMEDKQKEQKNNLPADNAIIEEVECVNFMCHAHLTVSLGPLINFIIGHNGSGKSAVLTALTLCLGAKATATNRGQSLKNFIKEGEDSARVSVKLKNQGPGAYQHHIYGDSIIVERHFNTKGISGFKIRNAQGQEKSNKKMELENISDAFQLQMNNPMNVLSQDMARQFLNSSTPSDKYKFFLEGTQLAVLDREYRVLAQLIEETDEKLQVASEDTVKRDAEYREARRKKDLADKHEEMRQKMYAYRRMYTWAQVQEQEEILGTAMGRIAACDEEIAQRIAQSDEASRVYDDAHNKLEEAQRIVQEQQESANPLREEKERIEAQVNSNKAELQAIQVQHRDIKGSLVAEGKLIDRLKDQIATEHQRQADAVGGEHARRLEAIQEAKTKAEDARRAYEDAKGSFGPLERAWSDATRRADNFKGVVQGKSGEVRQQRERIDKIRATQGKWMSAFPRELPRLLEAISRNKNMFRDEPVGPIGRHIKLLKPKWSPILERSFGANLFGFAVTNKRDEGVLRNLMRDAKYSAPVMICKAAPIDCSRHEPDPNLDTWLRVLHFEHDIIRNLAIINHAAEQTVLIENQSEAFDYAYGNEAGKPRNVKQVFCFARGSQVDGRRLGWTNAGGRSESPVKPWLDAARMQTTAESQITTANESLQSLRTELAELERELKLRQDAAVRASQALEKHKRDTKHFQVQAQKAEEECEKMQDSLEAEQPQDGKLDELHAQLKEAEDTHYLNIQMLEDAKAERIRLQEKASDLQSRVEEILNGIEQIMAQARKAESRVRKLEEARRKALQRKNAALEAVDELRQQKESFEQERREQEQKVQEFTDQAGEVCDRVEIPEGETVASLETKCERLSRDLREQEQELGGSAEELKQALFAAKAAWYSCRVIQKKLQNTNLKMKGVLLNRRARLTKFRVLIADRASVTFTYMLSARKFRGNLMIDSRKKELEIQVEPDITKRDAAGRQTKTLSGGEKSFSTVCLLLSLWDAMGAPTRCLDEFDVFMDNVNREMSMKMIIEACRGSPSKQFIFITPQAMGNVKMGPDVKIIKMSDPERGQRTLPPEYGRR